MIEIILFWIGITLMCILGFNIGTFGGMLLITGILDNNNHILARITCIFGGLFAVTSGAGIILLTLHKYGLLL